MNKQKLILVLTVVCAAISAALVFGRYQWAAAVSAALYALVVAVEYAIKRISR
ncbi:hypothetical protein H3N91_000208 [Salmonella enterica]|nr:hypothetical protein [Salmonella enterica]EEA2271392.1 hypothetical protein [Salmonella enterica]EFV5114797.1 hypothetical protein [Salmonella enterica]EGB7057497.1 hypothetical protein [Salmonella enterica]EGO6390946.1 hypothetical protein [Salmonella enterica]